jgi:hypothetical protein
MRSFLGNRRRPGLPVPAVSPLVWGLAGVGIAAVLLGRTAREPAAHPSPRRPAHPRYLGVDWVAYHQGMPHLLDTETGAFTPYPVPGVKQLGLSGCSPWRDGEGQYHLVGPCRDDTDGTFGLVRCSFPAGRVIDRVGLDFAPRGRPCWAPDLSDRILAAPDR